jgi:hypothetical protein
VKSFVHIRKKGGRTNTKQDRRIEEKKASSQIEIMGLEKKKNKHAKKTKTSSPAGIDNKPQRTKRAFGFWHRK